MRLLVWALLVQLALGGVLVFFAVRGFPFVGAAGEDGRGDGARVQAVAPAAGAPAPGVDRFLAGRAYALVRTQVAVGQRPAGSPQLRGLSIRLRALLPRGRFEAVPGGLRNVVGHLPGRRPAIVIGAHYDTEALPRGFVGANDGAAGTAVVIEVARALSQVRRRPGAPELRFVLFDGEEEPAGSTNFLRDALRGSRAYVRAHRAEVRAMILLDYVGNRGLVLPRERSSDAVLWARLRAAAARVGAGRAFPARTAGTVYDDHTPFLQAGIPAIDLIDFSYPHRDTVGDTLDKISPASLDLVGESVVELARGL